MPPSTLLPKSFTLKKSRILSQLSVPATEYDDLSPKGSIDEGIRDLIDGINTREGWVTTSSCAGRVVVFVEGVKRARSMEEGGKGEDGERKEEHGKGDGGGEDDGGGETSGEGDGRWERTEEDEKAGRVKLAATGGKGGGGRWLFVSHEPAEIQNLAGRDSLEVLGMKRRVETFEARTPFTEKRLIHFKFEPMVS
jgi:tRNA wybutosine-synthesizing protein 3